MGDARLKNYLTIDRRDEGSCYVIYCQRCETDNTISDDVWSNVVKEVNDNHLDYSSQVISEDILNVLVEHGVNA